MTNEVRADPARLVGLARSSLQASVLLDGGFQRDREMLAIPTAAFGDAAVAGGVWASASDAADNLTTTIGRLVAVYEQDADNLDQTAASYQKADDDAAVQLDRLRLVPGPH